MRRRLGGELKKIHIIHVIYKCIFPKQEKVKNEVGTQRIREKNGEKERERRRNRRKKIKDIKEGSESMRHKEEKRKDNERERMRPREIEIKKEIELVNK